ncbi:hypothetical protein GvMRE_Ic1g157 [endosymbiont GvMRE of Glomus versiforme]|nr:hypothetical protein GvMRE_Ic1g157 [endosymbiont GvMRE of Glomus versiforme]
MGSQKRHEGATNMLRKYIERYERGENIYDIAVASPESFGTSFHYSGIE